MFACRCCVNQPPCLEWVAGAAYSTTGAGAAIFCGAVGGVVAGAGGSAAPAGAVMVTASAAAENRLSRLFFMTHLRVKDLETKKARERTLPGPRIYSLLC